MDSFRPSHRTQRVRSLLPNNNPDPVSFPPVLRTGSPAGAKAAGLGRISLTGFVHRYSRRSAVIGSILVARRAGTYAAANVTLAKKRGVVTYAAGSKGFIAKKTDATIFEATMQSGMPRAIPSVTRSMDPVTTVRSALRGGAPSAIRMPISRVRWTTTKATTPYRPMHVMIRARTPFNFRGNGSRTVISNGEVAYISSKAWFCARNCEKSA